MVQHSEPPPQSAPVRSATAGTPYRRNGRTVMPPLDLRPTGRLSHVVAAYRPDTTARTALAALDAAATLRAAVGRLAQLYEVSPVVTVDRNNVVIGAHVPLPDQPQDRPEFLAGDIADLIGGDLQPEVSPDLWVTLTAAGIHNEAGVYISVGIPPAEPAEDGGR